MTFGLKWMCVVVIEHDMKVEMFAMTVIVKKVKWGQENLPECKSRRSRFCVKQEASLKRHCYYYSNYYYYCYYYLLLLSFIIIIIIIIIISIIIIIIIISVINIIIIIIIIIKAVYIYYVLFADTAFLL